MGIPSRAYILSIPAARPIALNIAIAAVLSLLRIIVVAWARCVAVNDLPPSRALIIVAARTSTFTELASSKVSAVE